MMEIRWHSQQEENMRVRKKGEVVYLTFPALDELQGLLHGFSTRLGGVSQGIYASMNLSFTRGDEEEAVLENYRLLGEAMGFAPENIVTSDQTHTTNVRVITEEDRGNGITRPRPYSDVDGMITDVPGLVLATFYADCVPLYLVDPVKKVIGLSHSGWRGTVGKIGAVTVEKMRETYGTDPQDVVAAIGPSICQNCYEVSEDVIEVFREAFASEYWDRLYYAKPNGRYQLDLWEANKIIFREAGLRPQNIHMSNLCTNCNPDFLYSHRASGGKRGNLGAFLGLLG